MARIVKFFTLFLTIIIFLPLSAVTSISIVLAENTATISEFIQETDLPFPLAHHTVHIYNNRVYVISGSGGPPHQDVWRADINNDGSLGAWQTVSLLPKALIFHTSVLIDNNIYVIGGSVDYPNNSQDSVYYSQIDSNGNLSPWAETSPLPMKLSEAQSFEYSNIIYVMGGATWFNGSLQGLSDTIFKANINGDGTLGNWEIAGILPQPTMAFSTYLNNNNLFILGGATSSKSSINKIYKSEIQNDGTVSSWSELPDLPFNSRRPAFIKKDGLLVHMGGYSGLSFLSAIYISPTDSDGNPLGWGQNPINMPTSNCCIPLVENESTIYIIGGHDGANYLDTVYKTHLIESNTHLLVPDLKQYSPPWGTMEYDTATNWSNNPTIERWGCALTSAAMVLQYHGHEGADPQILNNWLNSQPDGYIRNGEVNWQAISRYSLENSDVDSSALEFRRYTADNTKVQEALDQENPPIIKVPNHFVVAKGAENSDFVVNDPASAKELLSEVENEYGNYTQINSYTPTETDLSYIMLVADKNVQISIKNSSGETVGESWTEDPLIDDIGKEEKSGEELNTYLVPKPHMGNYYAEVTGNGFYQLDSYLYDMLGNPVISENKGYVNDSNPDTYVITIGEENQFIQDTSLSQILSDLEHLYAEGHFKNKGTFTVLFRLVQNAQKLYEDGKSNQTQTILQSALRFIDTQTPLHISTEAAGIIRNQILLTIGNLTV